MPSFLPVPQYLTPQLGTQTTPNFAHMSDAQLVRYVEEMDPRQLNKMVKQIGHQSAIKAVVDDTALMHVREQRNILFKALTAIKNKSVSAQDFDTHFANLELGQVFTTHPQQIGLAKEVQLLTQRARIMQSYDYSHGSPLQKLLTRAKIAWIDKKLSALPLYSREVLKALPEARLKYQAIQNNIDAAVDTTIKLRQQAIALYPELNHKNAHIFNKALYHTFNWLGVDNDRGTVTPEEAAIVRKELSTQAFKSQIAELKEARKYLPREQQMLIDEQIAQLHQTAKTQGLTPQSRFAKLTQTTYSQAVAKFTSPDNHVADLQRIQSQVTRGSKEFWALERAIERARIAGFHLSPSQPRQSGEVLNDIMAAFTRQLNHKELSTIPQNQQIAFLNRHLQQAKAGQLNFDKLDYSHLSADRQNEVRKFLKWFDAYKSTRSQFGAAALDEMVLANATSPHQAGALRVIAESKGIDTGRGGLKFCLLVETAEDQKLFRSLVGFIQDKRKTFDFLFPNGLRLQQACSDTTRVNGLHYAWHHVVGLGRKLAGFSHRVYYGCGAAWQRFGAMWADQTVENMPDGTTKFLATQQSDIVHRTNRTIRQASANMEHYFANFLARAFGIGNNGNRADGLKIKAMADRSHDIFLEKIKNNPAFNKYLAKFTTIPYHKALNPGSRGSIGFPEMLKVMLDKIPTHASSRAIQLSFETMLAGTPYSGLTGHVIQEALDNGNITYDKLHKIYKTNSNYRAFIRSTLRGMATADAGIVQEVFKKELAQTDFQDVNQLLNFKQADYKLMKKHLPFIIEGANTTKSWDQLLTRTDWVNIRLTRAAALVNLKRVQSLDPTAKLFRTINFGKLGQWAFKNFAFLPKQGKTFVHMMNAMAAFSRVARTGG